MNLQAEIELASLLRSGSQIARVVTEDWCGREMYCPACDGENLTKTKTGSPVCDFTCTNCHERFELKSGRHRFGSKIPDSAYSAMIAAIHNDRTPNLLAAQYSQSFSIVNLFVVPRYFINEEAIEKRAPLGIHARRAGWVGCNILLSRIPSDGRISVLTDGVPSPAAEVRKLFGKAKELHKIPVPSRGWTVDVLNVIRSVGKEEFSLADAYKFEGRLEEMHAQNRNIRPKIRQQLQVLRDLGFLQFLGRGHYRFCD
jgi:type II restriction enzyme